MEMIGITRSDGNYETLGLEIWVVIEYLKRSP